MNTITSSNSQAALAAELSRAREAIRKALAILTARAEEPWSPKIAAAVPVLREGIK